MPRGLGDDPLAKKRGRNRRGSPSQNLTDKPSTERAADTLLPDIAATTTFALSQNDVFFKRRGEEAPPTEEDAVAQQQDRAGPNERTDTARVPEISEAVDIIRIAEVLQSAQVDKAKVTKQASEDSTAYIPSTSRVDNPFVASEPQPHTTLEGDFASESLPRGADGLAMPADEVPSITEAAPTTSSTTPSAQTIPESQVRPDEKRKGILNRLFGRFGR